MKYKLANNESFQVDGVMEATKSGDVYIKDVGGYDGTNPGSATPINQLIGQGGNSPLIVRGTLHHDEDFTPGDGQPSFNDAFSAFLSGRTVLLIDSENNSSAQAVIYSSQSGNALSSHYWNWETQE